MLHSKPLYTQFVSQCLGFTCHFPSANRNEIMHLNMKLYTYVAEILTIQNDRKTSLILVPILYLEIWEVHIRVGEPFLLTPVAAGTTTRNSFMILELVLIFFIF